MVNVGEYAIHGPYGYGLSPKKNTRRDLTQRSTGTLCQSKGAGLGPKLVICRFITLVRGHISHL